MVANNKMQRQFTGSFQLSHTQDVQQNTVPTYAHKQSKLIFPHRHSQRPLSEAQAPDDFDDESVIERKPKSRCIKMLVMLYRVFIPNETPWLMMLAILIVLCLLSFSKASENIKPPFAFYTIYLVGSFILLIIWFTLRLFWIYLISPVLFVATSRIIPAIASMLDPEIIYLGFSISLYAVWDRVIERLEDTTTTSTDDHGRHSFCNVKVNVPGFGPLILKVGEFDLKILQRTEIFIILWAARDVVVRLIMFFFLLNFLFNVNLGVIKYLNLYSLIRKLNANWIRLFPICDKLLCREDHDIPKYGETLSDSSGVYAQLESKNFLSYKQQSLQLNEVTLKMGSTGSTIKPADPTQNACVMLDENRSQISALRSPPTVTKMKPSRKTTSTDLDHAFMKLRSIRLGYNEKKATLKDKYHVKYTGENLPRFLTRDNILKTKTSGFHNLLSIEAMQREPAVLFIRGVRIELNSKRLTRLTGGQLFDELIEFRNRLNAVQDLSWTEPEISRLAKSQLLTTKNIMEKSSKGFQVPQLEATTASTSPVIDSPPTASELYKRSRRCNSNRLSGPDKFSPSNNIKHSDIGFQSIIKKNENSVNEEKQCEGQTDDVSDKEKFNSEATQSMLLDKQLHQSQTNTFISVGIDNTFQRPRADSGVSKEGLNMPDGPAMFRKNAEIAAQRASEQHLEREFFGLFVGDQIDEFMKYADPGGRGQVSKKQFIQMIVEVYEARKQTLALIESQAGIRAVFRRMVAILLTFVAVLIFLIVLGVSVNTIVISGAAAASSITVALSFIYSGFIQSVLFVCFLNPYNVGDRIRLEDKPYTVKKISTYFTECTDAFGKPTFWNHSVLYNMNITNDSRSRNAGLEIPFIVAYDTPPFKYEALHKVAEEYVQLTPELVKDSFVCIMNEVVVGHYIKFTYWSTCVDGWHLWKSVWTIRGRFIQMIIRQCKLLDIRYHLPIQPVCVNTGHNVYSSQSISLNTSQRS